ncbi:hypothetical protein PCC8801_3385 [Rippkaea orientalis PCC 8801]|uniref:Uncharacterized protein n=1 Tax=Rippkaea orientalis (strain PCC 8801 / RF-1) TaxID=41431 RepID=B7JZE2_RIPO1|nr:hypothetical protein [Rippkaea orientalis]ACK67353.1 hypothetical protein PCC8801_3385 [Rippkaea orientalis PCC 8801]
MLNHYRPSTSNSALFLAGCLSLLGLFIETTALAAILTPSSDYPIESELSLPNHDFLTHDITDLFSNITGFSNNINDPNQVLELLITQKTPESLGNIRPRSAVSSENSSLSLSSIIESFGKLKFDATANTEESPDVPTLSQTNWSDIYRGIYDFNPRATTDNEESEDSIVFDPFASVSPQTDSDPSTSPPPTVASPNAVPPSVVGTPGRVFSVPQISFGTPRGQKSLPSASGYHSGAQEDELINVFFASLPKEQLVNIDEFLRTVYRTDPREMIERIDKTLDLTVDTQFHLMPKEIFGNPYPRLPANFNGTL